VRYQFLNDWVRGNESKVKGEVRKVRIIGERQRKVMVLANKRGSIVSMSELDVEQEGRKEKKKKKKKKKKKN